MIEHVLNHLQHLAGTMLPIPINLHRDVIIVKRRIPIPRLHCPANPQIKWQWHHRRPRRYVPHRVVHRSIINYYHIKVRQSPPQVANQRANRFPLIKHRHNRQAARASL